MMQESQDRKMPLNNIYGFVVNYHAMQGMLSHSRLTQRDHSIIRKTWAGKVGETLYIVDKESAV